MDEEIRQLALALQSLGPDEYPFSFYEDTARQMYLDRQESNKEI